MRWTDSLLTGIREIDEQHQVLFDVSARLDLAISSGNTWSAVHFAIVELTNFMNIHFAVEEALMRLHGYPGLDDHIADHPALDLLLEGVLATPWDQPFEGPIGLNEEENQ